MDPSAFHVFDQHFEVHGDKFDYATVRGIRWKWIERIRFVFFVPVGASYTYELTFEFANAAPLDLGVGSLPTRYAPALGKADFEKLEASVQRVMEKTRELRLAPYREQMKSKGLFEYDRKEFHADGTVIAKGRQLTLDLESRAQASATTTTLKCRPKGELRVDTAWDRDCFHVLLNDMHKQATIKRR